MEAVHGDFSSSQKTSVELGIEGLESMEKVVRPGNVRVVM